jgi:multiple sugar transport system permease protein
MARSIPRRLSFSSIHDLIPFPTWLLMGYFRTIPFELEECALIDGAADGRSSRASSFHLAAGPDLGFIFSFTLCWNEFIYALRHLHAEQEVPVAIVNEFVDGDIYRWGSLMAGALVGSCRLCSPCVLREHYVSAMTGAVKE